MRVWTDATARQCHRRSWVWPTRIHHSIPGTLELYSEAGAFSIRFESTTLSIRSDLSFDCFLSMLSLSSQESMWPLLKCDSFFRIESQRLALVKMKFRDKNRRSQSFAVMRLWLSSDTCLTDWREVHCSAKQRCAEAADSSHRSVGWVLNVRRECNHRDWTEYCDRR